MLHERNTPSVKHNPYEKFANTTLILRDQLAIDRTLLANERTFLAYCRTALAIILTGAGCIKIFDTVFSDLAGWMLIALGLSVIAVGIKRTVRIAHNIETVQRQPDGSNVQHSQSSQRQDMPNTPDPDNP
ncbi:MAG: DUF202 domain-containing protein [Deltaproteobacteria bacterium]|nr:DUF202 domain-containing protein [Deltaproteobacteria bacterium]